MSTIVNTYPLTLQKLVDTLKAETEKSPLTPKRVKEIVAEVKVDVKDLMEYADFDHPVADCYGRKLVHDEGNFEVMVMSWNPRDYSSIHDHGHTEWGVVQVFGPTHHFIYNVQDNQLRIAARQLLPTGEIIKVNHPLIHQMGNATSEPYLTLHVYGSNSRDEDVTADARNFDLEHDRISHTTGGAFFNLPADQIYDFEPAPQPDQETFLHYAHLLMDYYNRQPESEAINQLKQNLLEKMGKNFLN